MARPKDGRLGHNKVDQRFFEEYGDQLEVLDAPEDLPWAARMEFSGNVEELGSIFALPRPEARCVGSAWVRDADGNYVTHTIEDPDNPGSTKRVRLQRPCGNWRIRGGKVCYKHGGSVTRVKEAAQIRLLCAADAAAGALVAIALDPAADGKTRVMAINSLLDRVGIRAGIELSADTKGFEKLLQGWLANGLSDAENAANA